jgi:hypothetical protein
MGLEPMIRVLQAPVSAPAIANGPGRDLGCRRDYAHPDLRQSHGASQPPIADAGSIMERRSCLESGESIAQHSPPQLGGTAVLRNCRSLRWMVEGTQTGARYSGLGAHSPASRPAKLRSGEAHGARWQCTAFRWSPAKSARSSSNADRAGVEITGAGQGYEANWSGKYRVPGTSQP